ncbi:MAG: hypothetical protein RR275_00835 [Lachnospiraceae bacterium]
MTVQTLLDNHLFQVLVTGNSERKISNVFCCDLLSIAMGKAPADCGWVTVMGNINTLAVASLTDTSCIVLAEGVSLDAAAIEKAKSIGITVFTTEQPIFDTALQIYQLLQL